ncbi:LacI family DNA-binding transcriptional regulator [Streptomyces indicus]|uniref:LacI family transcriptional regulator n=1 Tax=Streptomyces indicus TaxID=417292 RepID=A0A1G8TWK8_9ACTN|nr:LacI family DNA-binding transcriptional regulator [Streptomyces indicus]SDJ45872.1 LacI family transcriptional regulator [Streptomyces indicus]
MTTTSRQRRTTIADVARAAGASISTVSRVVNGVDTVDAALAERVRRTVVELGYRPNAAAQGLARGRSGTIGVLVPDLANPYFHDMLKALSALARGGGQRVLVMDSGEDPYEERELAEDLIRHSDGILLCSPRMPRADLAALAHRGHPMVVANRVVLGLELHTITVDFFGGMLAVCGHLAQLGHREVVYLSGPEASWANAERLRALEAARAFGLSFRTIPCGSTTEAGYETASAALESGTRAVVAYNDFVALGALARCADLGVRVPEEVSVTGFDDIGMARYASPGLTTVRVPRDTLGRLAGEALARLLQGAGGEDPAAVPVELQVRGSTAAPAGAPSAAG